MGDFSERLKEERQRLGLNQEGFAALGGVQKQAQFNYEKGVRKPDSDYLVALAGHGVDVLYVLTGRRSDSSPLLPDETELLSGFRQLTDVGQAAIQASINGYLLAGVLTLSGGPVKDVRILSTDRAAKLEEFALQSVEAIEADVGRVKSGRTSPKRGGETNQD
ncbi:helix-turn-helix domain-containing protein [Burkholderia contaminans]|uniref:Putative phage-related regulator n=1 Tax=Burkholderia contaminans TaxID=488447 RepID=A0A6P2ZW23_9BURK|nr:helix-turn-helix transcriptional regulator [Burkholderia contaminans]VWD35655.1 putative phage-related regulator [Burkholderia contaminans]